MSDETTFDFALYLGTTTPLTITGATILTDSADTTTTASEAS